MGAGHPSPAVPRCVGVMKPEPGTWALKCPLCSFPRAAATTGHKLGGLKYHQCIFSHSGGWKSEIKASTGSAPSGSSEASSPSHGFRGGCRKSCAPLEV